MIKPITRDISLTLVIKLLLLFVLWWVCIRTIHPRLEESDMWLLGPQEQTLSQQVIKR
ncbi:cytochrome oxidase putative small subunit CydP [Legionella sp. 227]|uniref:cytochrome oxidase putative small subunit CydP n=1 Tax=Legionella sp. 227 TaxID=3367288 RepID=UPI00370DD40F